jgi:hypothetical protein
VVHSLNILIILLGQLKLVEGLRIKTEKKTVDAMIHLFCRKHHGTHGVMDFLKCNELHDYSILPLSKCPSKKTNKPVLNVLSIATNRTLK